MIIDTHAHFDDEDFDADREEVLAEQKRVGIETIINAAASLESVETTLQLANSHDFVYAMVGVHPDNASTLTGEHMAYFKKLTENPKVVAIGEIGLDYHWDASPRDVQKRWFMEQMEVARQTKLPICVHSRDAAEDTLKVMQEAHAEEIGGVVHCYSYSVEQAKEYLKMGFYFGIGGVVTFKNGRKCKEVVDMLPLERILLETDCPYLSPEPNRGKRNTSANLFYVAEEIAAIKGVSKEEVMRQTTENARRLYTRLQ